MELWEGKAKAGPHMHAMHSFYSVGALLGPIVTKPFLSHTIPADPNDPTDLSEPVKVPSQIAILYAIVGLAPILTFVGLFAFGAYDLCRNDPEVKSEEDEVKGEAPRGGRALKASFLAVMFVVYMIYVATEMCIGVFVPTFAVLSDLGLDKFGGANLLTAFLSGFVLTRLVAIFVSFKVTPRVILAVNLTTASLGNTLLIALGRNYAEAAFVGYFVIGAGTGSMYANAVNWMQDYVKVDSKVTGMIGIAGCLGAASLPSVMGQLIEWHPNSLIYAHFTSNFLLVILFATAALIGKGLLGPKAEKVEKPVSTSL